MAGGQRAGADDMDIVLDRVASRFGGRPKEGPDIDIESEVCKGRGNHFYPPVMTVLSHLGYEHPRSTPKFCLKFFRTFAYRFKYFIAGVFISIYTGNTLRCGHISVENLLHCI